MEARRGFGKTEGPADVLLDPRKLRELRERAAYLSRLKELITDSRYNVAIIGAWSSGELVEPPEMKISGALVFLPFILSVPAALLAHMFLLQIATGVSAIVGSYTLIYFYLKRKCVKIDFITIIKTKYNDIEFLRKNKKKVLEDPSLLGEYEAYHIRAKGLCVVRDRAANAMSFEFPFGNLVVVTTGLLAKLTPEEFEAALKHEEGHLRLHHMYKILAFLISEFILRSYLIHYVYSNISLYLLGIHLIGASLMYTSLIRLYEYEADKYARSRRLASALLKVGWNEVVDEVLYPAYSRLKFLVKTHPNTLDRVLRIWMSSGI